MIGPMNLRTLLITLVSGALLGVAFPAWHWWPLAWVVLAPLFYRASKDAAGVAALHYFVAGFVFHAIVLQWLLGNVYWAGGWAIWGYVLLCIYLALYWALLGAVLAWLLPRVPLGIGALATGALWAAMEFAQARMFTGFGWSALGYSQGPDFAFLQLAAIGSVNILGFVIATFNALVAYAVASPRRRWALALAATLLIVGAHGIGMLLIQPAQYGEEPFRVGIVQSDFPLEMKWDPEYTLEMVRNAANKSRTLAARKPVNLFVWPESVVMDPVDTPGIRETLTALTRDTQTPLYTGSMRVSGEASLNSSHLILPNGAIAGEYDKAHLVPFGEYVPLSTLLPFISKIVPAIGDVAAGDGMKSLTVDGTTFGPLICFEVLFPEMSEYLRSKGATMLVVITNLGWFGASNAIPEELEIARMRAVEARLPLIHAANTGISGVFDPWGRFTLVRGWFDRSGAMYEARDDIEPSVTVMQRMADSLDVAQPGQRPIPYGPPVFPWLMVLAALAFLAVGLLRPARSTSTSLLRSHA